MALGAAHPTGARARTPCLLPINDSCGCVLFIFGSPAGAVPKQGCYTRGCGKAGPFYLLQRRGRRVSASRCRKNYDARPIPGWERL